MITSHWFPASDIAAMEAAWDIRERVFVTEQGFSPETERDEQDATALHLLLYEDGTPVATGRILCREDGRFFAGRVAVLPAYRRQHIGDMLMRMLIRKVRTMGGAEVWVDSQDHAVPFYTYLGFTLREPEGHMDEHVRHYYMALEAGREPPRACEKGQ